MNSRYNSFTNNVAVPVALYPTLPQMGIPGCTATSVTCNISSLQGLRVNTGDHNAGPQKGKGYSFGLDFHPDFLRNLSGQVTYWHEGLKGAVTGPQIGFVVNTASLAHLLTFYPGGATPAEIAAATAHIPAVSALPTRTDYILEVINSNYLNLNVSGIDASVSYTIHAGGAGTFVIGDAFTYFTKFDQSLRCGRYLLQRPEHHRCQRRVPFGTASNARQPRLAARRAERQPIHELHRQVQELVVERRQSGHVNAQNNPSGGGDRVKANATFDANIAYTFKGGFLDGQVVSLNVRNIFNRRPPFYNGASGYDSYVANVLGRQVSAGLQLKF